MPTPPRDEDAPYSAHELPRMARESAQQIWLAGLGAFAKAQQEGGKVFEALVREGQELQRKTHSATQEHLSNAAQRMGHLASGLGERATGQWERLEGMVEDGVARTLQRLGVPTAQELQQLRERIAALEQALGQAQGGQPQENAAPGGEDRH